MDDDWLDDAALFKAWRSFVEGDATPFTIPGHKRRAGHLDAALGRLLDADVPLYGGLDDVKLSSGVLAAAEQRAARAWGADWCRFSTGGSTHAVQAVCLALGKPGDTVVVTRTAHRSMLLGLVLAGLRPVWVSPRLDDALGVVVGTEAVDVEAALAANPGAVGVLCVEPSYLGTCSDLPAIVGVAHARGVPVVVDQAWGAHFGFADGYPGHALAAGADAMVVSAHKTLPAFSQAALAFATSARLDPDRLDRAFDAAGTTSPAGAVLASIDASRALLTHPTGRRLLGDLRVRVQGVRERLADKGMRTLGADDVGPGRLDPAKLVLLPALSGHSGLELESALLGEGMPVEMADRDTVVAMITLADDDTSVGRLTDVLLDAIAGSGGEPRAAEAAAHWTHQAPQALSPRDAFFAAHRAVALDASLGLVSAEVVAPYPPGVPLLVPGEVITADTLAALRSARATGARIAYAADDSLRTVQVVDDVTPTPPR